MASEASPEFDPFGQQEPDQGASFRQSLARQVALRQARAQEDRLVRTLLKTFQCEQAIPALRRLQATTEADLTGGLRFWTFRTLFPSFPCELQARRVPRVALLGVAELLDPRGAKQRRWWLRAFTAWREEIIEDIPVGLVFGPLVGVKGRYLLAHDGPVTLCGTAPALYYPGGETEQPIWVQPLQGWLTQLQQYWRPE